LKNNITKDYANIYDQALKMMTSRDLAAFDLNNENESTKELYGKNEFGYSCLLARRLVEIGVPYMSLTHHGWDDHYEIYNEMGERAVSLDQGVAALMSELPLAKIVARIILQKPPLHVKHMNNCNSPGYIWPFKSEVHGEKVVDCY
jgi:hypothetical protein